MRTQQQKAHIGIVGCGAIGSRIAKSIKYDLKAICRVTALYDINFQKSTNLARHLRQTNVIKTSLTDLLKSCDFVVEAINTDINPIIRQALKAKKNILVMSVGKLLNAKKLFALAQKNECALLLPSGAIAGLDAIKAASLANLSSVTLTTRKPLSGFKNVDYLIKKRINLEKIKSETTLFEGDVETAVELFPQNLNVSAALALAVQTKDKVRIRLVTSPEYKTNSHEIEAIGDFGRIVSRTDNTVCPDNPKTSYLAVLSGIQTLKQFFNKTKIGT